MVLYLCRKCIGDNYCCPNLLFKTINDRYKNVLVCNRETSGIFGKLYSVNATDMNQYCNVDLELVRFPLNPLHIKCDRTLKIYWPNEWSTESYFLAMFSNSEFNENSKGQHSNVNIRLMMLITNSLTSGMLVDHLKLVYKILISNLAICHYIDSHRLLYRIMHKVSFLYVVLHKILECTEATREESEFFVNNQLAYFTNTILNVTSCLHSQVPDILGFVDLINIKDSNRAAQQIENGRRKVFTLVIFIGSVC